MIDVSAAVSERIAKLRPNRLGHGGLTVTAVANGCPRAVYHELRGSPKTFPDRVKKVMEWGHDWEAKVIDSLLDQGHILFPRQVVNFGPFPGREATFTPADEFDAAPTAFASPEDLIGHPDAVVRDKDGQLTVVEVKTYGGNVTWEDVPAVLAKQAQYIHQTVAYAYAYKAKALLYVIGRGGVNSGEKQYEIDVAAHWPGFVDRWRRLLPALGESEPEIDLPTWHGSSSYICGGCVATKCANRR